METEEVKMEDEMSWDGDVEPMTPEGWKEGVTLDELATTPNDLDQPAGDERSLEELLADGEETNGTVGVEAKPSEEESSGTASRVITMPDGETVDFGQMDDAALIELIQHSREYIKAADETARENYERVYQEQLDAGMTDMLAKIAARESAGGKDYPLHKGDQVAGAEEKHEEAGGRNLRAEVEQLRALYPNIKKIPDDVSRAAAAGVPLLQAWIMHQQAESEKRTAAAEAEAARLRQEADARRRAPVKGVSGRPAGKPKSLFEAAWDAGMSWE